MHFYQIEPQGIHTFLVGLIRFAWQYFVKESY